MSLIPCTYKWFYFGQSNYNKITQTHGVALRQYKYIITNAQVLYAVEPTTIYRVRKRRRS